MFHQPAYVKQTRGNVCLFRKQPLFLKALNQLCKMGLKEQLNSHGLCQ
jgi:hypothetical protein